jgi:sterol desaturase/sphingolipid hydroxylase (fatty acid hydroxylase superfamily)
MSRKSSSSSLGEIKIEDVLDYERSRYSRKGYGLIMASLMTFCWFIFVPQILPFIWPKQIENEGKFFFFASIINHLGIFIICNFVMWIIYKLEWDFFERYKTHDKPWPWKDDYQKWMKLIKQTILILFLNQGIILPLLLLNYYILDVCPHRVDFETLPSSFEVIWQTIFFMVVEDFTFYWGHRFLHWDAIYPYIHKLHHKYINTVSIASEFSNPLEFIFINVLTTNLGSLMLGKRVHCATQLMWILLRIGETTDGHCGYEFSWSPYRLLPMSASSEYHNYHHLNFKGNYASFFTVWDTICNTVNSKYKQFHEKKISITEKQKKEKEKEKIK